VVAVLALKLAAVDGRDGAILVQVVGKRNQLVLAGLDYLHCPRPGLGQQYPTTRSCRLHRSARDLLQ
jgi:hypothetical protein